MFVKKVLMIVLVSVIYLINLNIPVAAEENEQDIIFSPNWMLENGYKEEVEENQEILPFATRVNVNWKVGLKTEKKTKTFHKNAGSKITVEASVFPTKKIRIGIVAKSIGRMYVETTDMAKKTFNIKKTGEWGGELRKHFSKERCSQTAMPFFAVFPLYFGLFLSPVQNQMHR